MTGVGGMPITFYQNGCLTFLFLSSWSITFSCFSMSSSVSPALLLLISLVARTFFSVSHSMWGVSSSVYWGMEKQQYSSVFSLLHILPGKTSTENHKPFSCQQLWAVEHHILELIFMYYYYLSKTEVKITNLERISPSFFSSSPLDLLSFSPISES